MTKRLSKFEQEVQRAAIEASEDSTRQDIGSLAPKGCVGLEVGVDTGQLSERFIKLNHFSSFHCVDKWDDHAHSREQYLAVAQKLLKYPEARVWRMTGQEFAMIVPDEMFGFIYIDCYAHTGQDSGEVLEALWPKLAYGGVFAGDDYDPRWWPKTVAAVDKFAERVDKQICIRDDFCESANIKQDGHPTWYFTK
jgi:hypothetical protein